MKVLSVKRYRLLVENLLMRGKRYRQLRRRRKALAKAGINPKLECGAKFFGRPRQYLPTMQAVANMELKPWHVIVSSDIEGVVKATIDTLPSRLQVRVRDEEVLTVSVDHLVNAVVKNTFLHLNMSSSSQSAPTVV